jgi:hypothetical protein
VIKMKFCLILVLTAAMEPAAWAEKCFAIHGRAVLYRGDGFFAIWHIGTHHVFSPVAGASYDVLFKAFDCESGQRQPALFADFTVCPVERYVPGAAQAVVVKKLEHPRVVSDWPVADTAKEYIESFVQWCGARRGPEDVDPKENDTLLLARWDLDADLQTFLDRSPGILTQCRDVLECRPETALQALDPKDEFRVGKIERMGGRYEAQILHFDSADTNGTLVAVVEFRRDSDRWLIVNFRYPAQRIDLRSILKARSLP